jgi:hypothetical protein
MMFVLICQLRNLFRIFVSIASENLEKFAVYNAKRLQILQKRQGNLFFEICYIIKILLNVSHIILPNILIVSRNSFETRR